MSPYLLLSLLPAGHTILWALYLVSQHPAVEARLAAGLDAAGLLLGLG